MCASIAVAANPNKNVMHHLKSKRVFNFQAPSQRVFQCYTHSLIKHAHETSLIHNILKSALSHLSFLSFFIFSCRALNFSFSVRQYVTRCVVWCV